MTNQPSLAARRRGLQLTLGLFWLLDAALQFQPYMFTSAFPRQVLAPVGPGNPRWIAQPVHWAAHLTAAHVVPFNAAFATVQLLIALGLFARSTVRVALVGSVLWALGIWCLGEGLGGMLVAPQSPIMGAPGAALIYAVISVLIWPRDEPVGRAASGRSVATTGPLGPAGSRLVWLALWGGLGVETLQAANRSPSGLRDLILGMADGEPGWLQAVNRDVAAAVAHHGTEVSVALAVGFVLIALAVLGGTSLTRSGLLAAIVLGAGVWVVGQDFGEIWTGQATDPNTGPLLILLAAAYWPITRSEPAAPATGEPLPALVLASARVG